MKVWSFKWLKDMSGGHIASEANIRIQIIQVPNEENELWKIPKGELLIIVLSGRCCIKTDDAEENLNQYDQVFLLEGESFSLFQIEENNKSIAQLLWMPGISK